MPKYYDEFRAILPETENSFPPYLFGVIDLIRRADKELDDLEREKSDLGKSLEEVKADLKTAQEANLSEMLETQPETTEESTTTEEMDGDTLPTITQIMDGVEKGDYELDF